MERQKIIIDTDPALGVFGRDVDDGLAIILALHSPELEVLGLTVTHGNVPLGRAVRCARNVLKAAGREDVPIHAGAGSKNDLGKKTEASEFIIDTLEKSPGDIALVPIGPLSNVATAETLCPGILGKAKCIVCMGGAVRKPGMVPPSMRPEFNFWKDPAAARLVVETAANLTLVPWDLTSSIVVEMKHLKKLREADTELGGFLYSNIVSWYALNVPLTFALAGRPGFFPHDPLAVGVLLWPEIYGYEEETLGVSVSGWDAGAVIRKAAGTKTRVAYTVDKPAFLERLFERLPAPVL